MKQLDVYNPFGAPVYHEAVVGSTMDVSRVLAGKGEPHGTAITADFQEEGRGRILQRIWNSEWGKNLLFTILLRYPRIEDIPLALTLRAGLAVSLAIEVFAPALAGKVLIKWPNDILIAFSRAGAGANAVEAKKVCGIYADADGGNVHLGIGVNLAQNKLPESLQGKATSISLAMQRLGNPFTGGAEARFLLLETILVQLYNELEADKEQHNWCKHINERLFKINTQVSFASGAADSNNVTTGILEGIGPEGELVILARGKNERQSFISGEMV